MKPLNLSDAMKLGTILYPYIPDEADDSLDFIGTIINNIKTSGKHIDYLNAIALMYGMSIDDVIKQDDSEFVLEMFAEGITLNNLLDLKIFFDSVGFGNG